MDENLSRGYVRLSRVAAEHDERFRNGATNNLANNHVSPPTDKYNLIYMAMLLAGVGFLLPYNSFTIAVDYYKTQYPHTTIIFDMSLVYIAMAFFAVLANNFLVETLSLNTRITFGYGISCVTLLFVAVGEIWLGLGGSDAGYTINLVAVAIVSLGCTVQQSSFYGYTSMLPSRYTQAVMAGESAAGFLVSVNRIVTKSLLDDDKVNTFIFFTLSVCLVACCFFLHNFVSKSQFVQFYFKMCNESKRLRLEPTEDNNLILDNEARPGQLSFANPLYEPHLGEDNYSSPTFKVEDVLRAESTARPSRWSDLKRGLHARWNVGKIIWPYMVTIWWAYFITLCLYPGIESEIVSCSWGSWMPVIIMAIFNASDLIGKMIAGVWYEWSPGNMMLVAGCRLFLIPLILLCAMPRGRPFISGEGYPMLFSMMLGLSNGIVGSIPMIMAPCKVAEEHRELAGNIMTLSYNVGLTAGSLAAYMFDSLLGPPVSFPNNCQPFYLNATKLPPLATTITTTTTTTLSMATTTMQTVTATLGLI